MYWVESTFEEQKQYRTKIFLNEIVILKKYDGYPMDKNYIWFLSDQIQCSLFNKLAKTYFINLYSEILKQNVDNLISLYKTFNVFTC